MEHVFEIHATYGRFFDEAIYKRELQRRMQGVELEFPIDVVFGSYSKRFLLDMLVESGAVFEFKAADRLNDKHRAQLLNYLLLTNLAHGRLVTTRTESVKYEFVNTTLTGESRRRFQVQQENWDEEVPGAKILADIVVHMLRDWGTGLDITLYEDAVTHHLGGEAAVHQRLQVMAGELPIGSQTLRMVAPQTAFKITCLGAAKFKSFATHSRRFMTHTGLKAILWINITHGLVQFTVLQ